VPVLVFTEFTAPLPPAIVPGSHVLSAWLQTKACPSVGGVELVLTSLSAFIEAAPIRASARVFVKNKLVEPSVISSVSSEAFMKAPAAATFAESVTSAPASIPASLD
jgi:hypothetical protein